MGRRWKTRSCWPRCGKHLEGRRKRCRCLWKKWWRIPRVWNRSSERSSSLEVPGDLLRYVVMSLLIDSFICNAGSFFVQKRNRLLLMVNMGTQGVVFVLQGRPAVAENQRHRAFYHTLSDSEAKLQFFAARQVACRILGSHGYLCHDVSSRLSSPKNIPEISAWRFVRILCIGFVGNKWWDAYSDVMKTLCEWERICQSV